MKMNLIIEFLGLSWCVIDLLIVFFSGLSIGLLLISYKSKKVKE